MLCLCVRSITHFYGSGPRIQLIGSTSFFILGVQDSISFNHRPNQRNLMRICLVYPRCRLLYVQEVVTQPKILNRTILYNLVYVTKN